MVGEGLLSRPSDVGFLRCLPLALGLALSHDTLRLAMVRFLRGLLDLLRRCRALRLGSRGFLFRTSLMLSRGCLVWTVAVVSLLRAVTRCAGLTLRGRGLCLVLLLDVGKVECRSRLLGLFIVSLLAVSGFAGRVGGNARFGLADDRGSRLLSSTVSNWISHWIWAWTDELRPLWWISRFLSVSAVFNR